MTDPLCKPTEDYTRAHVSRVSVAILCYNHAHFLEQAIGSVLTQSYSDFEIIVVDDGSIEVYAIYEVSDRAEVQS